MAKKVNGIEDEVSMIEAQPEPNVMFIGGHFDTSAKNVKEGEPGFMPREPIKAFKDGMKQYRLPHTDEQLKGPFYYEDAGVLVRLFPKLYKTYVAKGS